MKQKNPDFIYGNLSDVGKVRTENQDYYGRYDENFGQLIIVCDGMGGYEGGAVASRLAVETISGHFKKLSSHYDPRFELEQAFVSAQQSIKEYAKTNPETESMGTTAVLLLIIGTNYWFANLGDSRLYLKRAGKITQLSKDHSFVQNMIDNGILNEAQAAEHPKRNIITKALGTDNFLPDISGPYALYKADVFMLCSDGLYQYFTLQEISTILEKEPQEACETLVDMANQQGSDDNVTVQIVKSNIGETIRNLPVGKNRIKWIAVLIASFLLVFLSSVYLSSSLSKVFRPRDNPAVNSSKKPADPGKGKVTADKDTIKGEKDIHPGSEELEPSISSKKAEPKKTIKGKP